MKKVSTKTFSLYLDVESAIAPIDDVIRLLYHAHEDFHLGQTSLDKMDQIDLLNRYETLGSIIKLTTDALERAVEEVREIGRTKLIDSDNQDQVVG